MLKDKTNLTKSIVALALILVTQVGCLSAAIVVRHQDPTQPVAEVIVDGVVRGTVRHGDELELGVERGSHTLSVAEPGRVANAWSEDERPFVVVVDSLCVVTLMTPARRRAGSQAPAQEVSP